MQFPAVILGIFGLEFGIKNHIEKTKTEGIEEKKCKGMLIIRKHHNRGAFLNVGQEKQKAVMVLSVLLTVLLAVFYIVTLGNGGKGLLKWGLTLLLGGAFSNTYDRMARKYVVDYVSFNVPWKWLRRIIFNISDFCIMIGAMMSAVGFCSGSAAG